MPKKSSGKAQKYISKSPTETKKIASKIIEKMGMKGTVCLYGNLGAGKTTFTKGCADLFGIPEKSIKSPSFTYIREYETAHGKVYHCDFYRLAGKNIIEKTLRELQEKEKAFFIIEWPEKLQQLSSARIDITISGSGEDERVIEVVEHIENI